MTHRPETLAVHAGQEEADPTTNARAVPIYQTTSYVFNDTEHAANLFALAEPGNIYTRIMNPTQSVFEDRINQLEGGVGALAVASGSSATFYSVLNLTYAGDNIVAISTLYGGTYALFAHTLPQFGIEVRFVDPTKPEELAQHVDEKTKLVFAETVGNPKINVVDLDAWSTAAHAAGLPLIVDNTTPTPYLVRPFDHGADVVVHSATKYIGGHGTSIGGVIVDSRQVRLGGARRALPRADRRPTRRTTARCGPRPPAPAAYIIRARTVLLRNTGAAITPFNSWLFLQGLETLHLRMERHSSNALAVAQYLQGHEAVSWVSYPGLESDPEQGGRGPHLHRARVRRPGQLRRDVRTRRRAALRGGAAAVQPPGQHRRRQVAGHPQRDHDPLPARPPRSSTTPGCPRTWCGSPSASSTSRT